MSTWLAVTTIEAICASLTACAEARRRQQQGRGDDEPTLSLRYSSRLRMSDHIGRRQVATCRCSDAGRDWRRCSGRARVAQPREHAGDDPVAARAGEPEHVDRRHVDVPRQRRAQQRARAEQPACGPSRPECRGTSAVSSTVMSSTSRMTNTVRYATGSSSMRRSSMRRISPRIAPSVGDSAVVRLRASAAARAAVAAPARTARRCGRAAAAAAASAPG